MVDTTAFADAPADILLGILARCAVFLDFEHATAVHVMVDHVTGQAWTLHCCAGTCLMQSQPWLHHMRRLVLNM